ncbi:F-box protein [Nocardia thraciensis]
MQAVITEVAVEGKRLIDEAWLGRITRDQAVHRFVQVGDGMVEFDTAADIVDDGLAWLDAHSTRLRLVRWCSVLELPVFGGLALIGVITGDYLAAGIAVTLLVALQYLHRRFAPHPPPVPRRPRARR